MSILLSPSHRGRQRSSVDIDSHNGRQRTRPWRRPWQLTHGHRVYPRQLYVPVSVLSAVSTTPNDTFAVGRCCQDDGPGIRVIMAGLLQLPPVHNRQWPAWCDGCRQSRTPPHVWSSALRGVTTSPQFSVSFIGCLFVIALSLSWPYWCSKRCTAISAVYLADDCQLFNYDHQTLLSA